mgnify:FL=1
MEVSVKSGEGQTLGSESEVDGVAKRTIDEHSACRTFIRILRVRLFLDNSVQFAYRFRQHRYRMSLMKQAN